MSKNWLLLIFCFFVFTPLFVNAQNFNEFLKILPIPGRVEGRGTHFEIKDSDYLHITLESEKEIEVVLESIPRMISLNLASSTETTTTLTLKGLEPNKKYFKYEDTHKNETEIFTDENGNYSWQQDLTEPHHIWIQEIKGTFFIPFDPSNPTSTNQCISPYGEWIPESRTCKLLQDLTEGIEITTSTLILDCNGHTIIGSGSGYGIYSFATESVTIKNCIIKNFSDGIYSLGSFEISISSSTISDNYNGIVISFYSDRIIEKVEITNSNIINNKGWGIFGGALSVEVKGNNISNNFHGLALSGREHQEFNGNIISNNQSIGFYLSPSIKSYLSSNQIENNKYNLSIGKENNLELLLHKIDTSNTVNGKPIYYLINERDKIIDSSLNPGYLGIVNSENITIRNLSIQNNGEGIFLAWTRNSKVEGNKISNNQFGIFLFSSSNNQIVGNEILNSQDFSIGNWGIVLTATSSNNLVRDNTILGNVTGIGVEYSSNNNLIYHNNFRNNYWGAQVWQATDNLFDNGYPSGGNFWSNYNTPDEGCFDENRDGFCDSPYTFFGGQDNYPFLKENSWILPKVLISEVYYNPDKKHQGEGNERDYEWVIIHNLEKNKIDLTGWQICDNTNCNSIPTSFIPSNGLAIITPTSTTFSFWRIPKNMVRIVLGNKFGGYGLANGGDRVILKDKEGKIVDAMSYGNDTFIFFPECTKELKAKEGKSLLRDPPYKDTDTCDDFKESEPTIGKNWPPIPIINFFPKNPIKGVKVKFDASLSDDPDGEIINFEWQIGTSTFTGTTTEFTFNENGEYQITLTATDNDGATSSTSTIIKVEPFSFAIITDLHIGRHYQEEYEGQDYYLTQRLRNVINWINQNKDKIQCGENATCSLKFLVILGDITENTSLAGFCKVKEILDQLQIPYVPVFGNHDVGTDEEYKQCSKWKGQDYFDQVFWSTSSIPCERASSTKNFELLSNELNFQRDETNKDYKNFSFSFGGINFIGLDFVSREPFMKFGKGVGADAVLNEINKGWLEKKLEEFGEGPVILFAHHPLTAKWGRIYAFTSEELSELERIIKDKTVLFDFGGHIHSFEEIHGVLAPPNANLLYPSVGITNVLTTEALMVGSNGRGVEEETGENGVVNGKKGIVRIVKVFEKNEIKPNSWETTEKGDEFLAFNPSLNLGFSIRRQFNNIPCVELEAHKFSEKPCDFLWNFGGKTSSVDCNSDFSECLVCYEEGGEYTITLFAKDKNSSFTESISKKITVNEAIIPRTIKKPAELIEKGIEFISEKAQMSFDKIGQVVKDKIRIFKKKSPAVPVGEITVHFENLNEDLDLSGLVTDTDFEKQKTILYMENWPEVVERSKILFIPKR